MGTHSIYKIDDNAIAVLISKASNRIVFMAPGLTMGVAQEVDKAWTRLGSTKINVILDVDPEVFRLGYGEIEALTFLESKAREKGTLISNQPGIRIGLLIVDEQVVIYTPQAKLIEANSSNSNHPNAIILGALPPNVAKDVGLGPLGIIDQVVGLEKAHSKDIEDVQEDLIANPPLKFNVAKTMNVFNSRFEFIEFELKNCHISRKEVPLESDLFGLAKGEKAYDNLRSSFKLINKDSSISEKKISGEKKRIADKYLIPIKGYGTIILRTKKVAFDKEVETLKAKIKVFQADIEEKLGKEITKNRKTLVAALLPAVQRKHPARWEKFINGATKKVRDTEVASMLDNEIEEAFEIAKKEVSKMDAVVVPKGITYELLHNADFMGIVKKAVPSMKDFFQEYAGVAGETPKATIAGTAPRTSPAL